MYEVRGGCPEEQPHVQGAVAAWAQEGRESHSMFKVRRGGSEEIPLVQGKEQRLRFAQGKRNPSKTVSVARGHQRAVTLKP